MPSDETNTIEPATPTLRDWFTPLRFAGLLALLIVGAFPEVATGSASWFKFDYGVLGYPFIQYQRDCFWRGELPLWNPLSNCGAPFLAQWGTMTLYPPALIYLLLPLPGSLGWFCLLHLFLGGLGMYFLARHWMSHTFAATGAGIFFVFNGIMLSCLIWPNYLVALGWMPWLVLLTEKAWRIGGRWLLLASLVGALQMLSGAPEIILFTWSIISLLAAADLWHKRIPARLLIGRYLLILVIVASLTAVQLLPFLDLLAHSQRDRTFATVKWAMPAWGWGNLLVPLFHYFMTPQGTYFQTGQEFLSSYYLGIGVLGLALLAAWRLRERRVWLLGGVTLFALIMAMGENGGVYSLLRQWIPMVGIARYPIKFILLLSLTMPLLAAYGLRWCDGNRVASPQTATKSLLLLGGILFLLTLLVLGFGSSNRFTYDQWPVTGINALTRLFYFAVLFGLAILFTRQTHWRKALLLAFGMVLIPVADNLTQLPNHNPTVPAIAYVPNLARDKFAFNPSLSPGQSRIFITPSAEELLLRSSVPDMTNDFLIKRFALWSNLNVVDGVPKVNGSSTLQIREQSEVQKLLYASTNTALPQLLDFLAVAYINPVGQFFTWTNRTTQLPWITGGQMPVFANAENTLAALTNAAFDPRTVVYLPLDAKSTVTVTTNARVQFSDFKISADRKEFFAEASANAIVVIAETYYHPWHVSVDGEPVALIRANHAFQALQVPPGKHRVEVIYRDQKFILGLWISLFALSSCALAGFRMWRHHDDW